MIHALGEMIRDHGMDYRAYFAGMESKLTMTVMNSALLLMGKEQILRLVIRIKRSAK